jgi:phosphatidylinositol kinase/protein kinase (PI-3  family)
VTVTERLQKQIAATRNPRCELDQLVVRSCGPLAREALAKADSERLMAVCHELYIGTRERSNKLSIVLLPKASDVLAAKHGSGSRFQDYIRPIEREMEGIVTQQYPPGLFMVSAAGKLYRYLLRGIDNLRNDERFMQFFSLTNSILREKDDCGTAVVSSAVVPLPFNAWLITWVDGANTFHQRGL